MLAAPGGGRQGWGWLAASAGPAAHIALLVPPAPGADYVTVALKWLEARGTADLDGLLERYTVKQYNLTALTADRVVEGGSAPGGAPAPEALPVPAPAPAPSLPRRRS